MLGFRGNEHTFESRGMNGQSCISSRSDFAKSYISSVFSLSQLELYPKLCILISRKPASFGSHSRGQKRVGSCPILHELRDPPANPCTNMRSAIACSGGTWRVFRPNGPFSSSSATSLPLSRRKRRGGDTNRSIPWLPHRLQPKISFDEANVRQNRRRRSYEQKAA